MVVTDSQGKGKAAVGRRRAAQRAGERVQCQSRRQRPAADVPMVNRNAARGRERDVVWNTHRAAGRRVESEEEKGSER